MKYDIYHMINHSKDFATHISNSNNIGKHSRRNCAERVQYILNSSFIDINYIINISAKYQFWLSIQSISRIQNATEHLK